jgi:hypothetical protein
VNTQPHIHQIIIKRKYGYNTPQGPWIVEYGDTTRTLTRLGCCFIEHDDHMPRKARVQRVIRRAIRDHDKGSVKAAAKTQVPALDFVAEMNAKLESGRWASEIIR